MSEAKHTPGQWIAADNGLSISIQDKDGREIARINGERLFPHKHAALIAAAPELLEALEQAFMALGRAGGNYLGDVTHKHNDIHPEIRKAWLAARDAIAKAEGRSC